MTTEYNPYQAPESPLVIESAPVQFELAGRGDRLAAAFLDGLIVGGPFIVIGIVGVITASSLQGASSDELFLWLFFGLGGLIALALLVWNWVLLTRYGQTIGKRICKIKIVRTDGSPVSLGRIIGLRWFPIALIGAIPVVGRFINLVDVLLIFRESRQCLHDQIADTIVVRA